MPRSKKTPEPVKRGPGRPRSADPVRRRLQVPLTDDLEARLTAYAARHGLALAEVGTLALDALLTPSRAAEDAYRMGAESTLREAIAGLQRQLDALPGES